MKKRILIGILAVVIGVMCTYMFEKEQKGNQIQEKIAKSVLRFHVLADSDSEEDQQLKLAVKEAVVDYLQGCMEEELTFEKTKEIIGKEKNAVIAIAQNVVYEHGSDDVVTAELTTDYFPVKQYGDVTLPAGEYEAFRIEIGDAEGKNWWCILYPPLCFVDVTYGYVPDESKQLLKNILDEECYRTIVNGGILQENVTIKSKIWEWIQNR